MDIDKGKHFSFAAEILVMLEVLTLFQTVLSNNSMRLLRYKRNMSKPHLSNAEREEQIAEHIQLYLSMKLWFVG